MIGVFVLLTIIPVERGLLFFPVVPASRYR